MTKTSIWLSFKALVAATNDFMAYFPIFSSLFPKFKSTPSRQMFKTFIFPVTNWSNLSIPCKGAVNSKVFLIKESTFTLAKITGVQSSSILESSKVLRITSLPIPFKSPMDIPTIIFSAFFIRRTSYLLLILKCKFSKIKP